MRRNERRCSQKCENRYGERTRHSALPFIAIPSRVGRSRRDVREPPATTREDTATNVGNASDGVLHGQGGAVLLTLTGYGLRALAVRWFRRADRSDYLGEGTERPVLPALTVDGRHVRAIPADRVAALASCGPRLFGRKFVCSAFSMRGLPSLTRNLALSFQGDHRKAAFPCVCHLCRLLCINI